MITASYKNSFVIDSQRLWASLAEVPQEDKLQYVLLASGVPFWDTEPRFAKDNAVCVRAVGGLPIVLDDQGLICIGGKGLPIEDALRAMTDTMGYAGMDSYLNPFDCTPSEMLDKTIGLHGVPSTAHIPTISLSVAGLSLKAELELACQRDLVHLSRLTSARTKAQDKPVFLVEQEWMLPVYRQILKVEMPNPAQNREIVNSAFPLSKCSLLTITGSVKNLLKIGQMQHDTGKEQEVRNIAAKIENAVLSLFPIFAKG